MTLQLLDDAKRTARNWMTRAKLQLLPKANLYAHTYASFHKAVSQRNADIRDAAQAIFDAEKALIDGEAHFYDLVVLDKRGAFVRVRDRRGDEHDLLDLVTNSYNDLEGFEETREALVRFVAGAPLSACLSRKIAGLHAVHDELKREVADFMGYDACVLGTCGYITQMSTIFALFHKGDVIFSDQHNHSSLADGCRLSHATVVPFPHRNYDQLETLLKSLRGHFNGAGILSDGVFSTRGAIADIDRIVALAKRYNCISVIDDTHGVTVIGREGRGAIDCFRARPDVVTGGFGKAFGAFGGFAVASRPLAAAIDILGRQNVNTSHLSPIMAAQALINLRYYREHHDAIASELFGKLHAFNDALAKHGLACYPEPHEHIHPIFCLYKKTEHDTLACQKRLVREGFLASFFPPPVAPYPSLRFSLHRSVPEGDLLRLVDQLKDMDLFVDGGGRTAA